MQRQSFLGIPAALVAAITLTFMAGCSEHPTDVGIQSPAEAVFVYEGFPGITGDAEQTPTSDYGDLPSGDHSWAFPSTNEDNIANGWANVIWNSNDAGLGEAPLKFTQPRNFSACFEIRIDDEAPAVTPHPNIPWYDDGRYDYRCLGPGYSASPLEETFIATSHVDVRLSMGAERDERFDWTRFYVMSVDSKDACQDGGWQEYGFANQGQCVRYVETGKQ